MKLRPFFLLIETLDNSLPGIVWTRSGGQPQGIQAVSEVWSWLNIMAVIGIGLGLVVIVGGVFIYLLLNKSKAKQPKKVGASSTPGSANIERQSAEAIRVRLTSYVPAVKPALHHVPGPGERKHLKKLSRPPR